MRWTTIGTPVFAIVLLCPLASPADEEEHRQHDAHEHGVGALNVAVEGKELHLELVSPGMNIVGFEHEPSDEAQKRAVKKAMETLKDAARVVTPSPAARCTPVSADVETAMLEEHEEGNEKHDEQAEEHHDDEGEEHSEFHMAYRFTCDAPEKLEYLDVHIFSLFERTEELAAQVIIEKGQTSQGLTRQNARLAF